MTNRIPFGLRHTYGGTRVPCFLPVADIARHVHVLGKTGMGKSTLLKGIVQHLIASGQGVCVIDPHGDLVGEILDALPLNRRDAVVLIDPADPEFAPALNVIANHRPSERPRIASALVSAFRHVWSDSWGPRLEYILYHSIRSLLDCQNVSLVALPLLLVDADYRRWVIGQVGDPFIRRFWTEEFNAYDPRFRQEAIAPIQNKIGQLLAIPAVRESIGQVRRRVDFRECMDTERILLVHLPKGLLGEDASRLLGAIIVSLIGDAAMSRSSLPPEERTPFFLVIDEVQNFMTDSFGLVLSEARKYGLGAVLCHQYLEQLSVSVRSAILGNAGTTVSFRSGAEDGELLARHYADAFAARQFLSLSPFDALVRPVSTDDLPYRITLAPSEFPIHGRGDRIRRASRFRYGSPRTRVRANLNRWIDRQ